ncbi:MAG: acetolactate synthase small subunit [ANME-2 cluster archaeon]|nr:acetolactate synthase small subunit [ANME-2 cluster archaeon]MBC2701133.1 acetolactate synthase small subunit [ANME-2 cluster archaeon]MBC2707603.1 acetolactate synthase small subunit [ANME-2 cluster archaeon]MBC2748430.1 acetolactate synthase small subunit [ANME-2 cluster archaeon]MBC2762092.1 acetolactate synthase small subunit [ANME-2 cluster archaeon]
MKHTLAILVENRSGVLTRVAGLFSRRGFNIESLAVGVTDNPDISRMTIVVSGDDHVLEQVIKQLNKLIDVIRVNDFEPGETIERELAFFKVKVDKGNRSEVMQIVDVFRAQIVDVGVKSLIVAVTGTNDKIDAIEKLLRGFGILEVVRTGTVAMNRGAKTVKPGK